jgi:hypothetical protein
VQTRYERRRPEQTTLYRPAPQHEAIVIAHAEANTRGELSWSIKDEFDTSSRPASWRTA